MLATEADTLVTAAHSNPRERGMESKDECEGSTCTIKAAIRRRPSWFVVGVNEVRAKVLAVGPDHPGRLCDKSSKVYRAGGPLDRAEASARMSTEGRGGGLYSC